MGTLAPLSTGTRIEAVVTTTTSSTAMARLAIFAALLVGALAAPAADPVPVPTQFTVDIPSIPKQTIDGVTFEAPSDVILTFTGIELTNNFDTTDKSIVLTNGAFEANLTHYITTGSVSGFNLEGDGTIDLKLGGKIINKVGYTSTSAESFCAVAGSVSIDITTHTASLEITGMKDQATAGQLVSQLIMKNYGDDINKYVVAIINSICKF